MKLQQELRQLGYTYEDDDPGLALSLHDAAFIMENIDDRCPTLDRMIYEASDALHTVLLKVGDNDELGHRIVEIREELTLQSEKFTTKKIAPVRKRF